MGSIETEAERQFYLSALGVRLWYARARLPGAAPTPDLDFTRYEQADVRETPALATRDAPKEVSSNRRPDIAQIMQDAAGSGESGEKVPALRARQNPPAVARGEPGSSVDDSPGGMQSTDALQGLSIDWGLWWCEDICLISTINDPTSYDLQSRLAINILASLNGTVKTQYRLHWPVFNNRQVPADSAAHLAQILEKLGGECGRMKSVVWLGVSAQGSGSLLQDFLGDASVEFAHSLSALASDPHLKRALWQQLQQHQLAE